MHSKPPVQSYDPLPQDECSGRSLSAPTGTRRWSTVSVGVLMMLEALVLIMAFVGYTQWHGAESRDREQYLSLAQYNKTVEFDLSLDHMEDSPESETFWHELIDNNGVVSIPTSWAESQGFAPSRAHPDQPDHSIYQIDAFHSIHCLYRVRSKLLGTTMSHGPETTENSTESGVSLGHTLHCINYIRQALMCHADLTLQGTKNMRSFIKNEGHQCRDFESLAGWAKRFSWEGHGEWLRENAEGKVQ